MPSIYFEDFKPGSERSYGDHTVDRDHMVAFAELYDAQPFHTSEAAAKASAVGHLIASGWYTAALQMRMLCDGLLLDAAGLGAPGVDELKWLRPVAAGDRLSARETILETREPKSRPDRGLVRFRMDVLRDGEPVMSQTQWCFFAKRGVPTLPATTPTDAASTPYTPPPPSDPGEEPADFDAVEIGRVAQLGSHRFTEDDIVGFGRDFDPQPFHVDPVAAANGPFGALAASGWHTASAWMSKLVAYREAAAAAAKAAWRPTPNWGVSPGFRDLKWLRPVLAGDTLHYATETTEKRLLASRPGWGHVSSLSRGHNQRGELVFEFRGGGFMAKNAG